MQVHSTMWSYSGAHLATAVWGLSELGHPLTQGFLETYVDASVSKLHTMTTEELIYAVQAFSLSK